MREGASQWIFFFVRRSGIQCFKASKNSRLIKTVRTLAQQVVLPWALLRLRVCHAFPSDEPMSVAWRDMVLTSDEHGAEILIPSCADGCV
jgi:hypothetical protein